MSKSNLSGVTNAAATITPAHIDWQTDDTGNPVPFSGEFGDVYFSHANGLAESRHVFIDSNQLPARLINLMPNQCFTIAELGFGTGLNLLAVWQLWQQLRATHSALSTARLHFITTEKYPIAYQDLKQILALWAARAPELSPLIEPLLANYPPLIAGCHRLSFSEDNLTVDIWLGDAADSLAKLATEADTIHQTPISCAYRPYVDAWFLDGFAPSCNQSLWADSIFEQMQRLSHIGTTAATYSCAGVVKRGLQQHGFGIKKITGFGRKLEMLTATRLPDDISLNPNAQASADNIMPKSLPKTLPTAIVIGAGVAGLLSAWSLANRGIEVTVLDKIAPLAGASGNPRALLAPKMTPIYHVDEHLHTMSYLYSSRLYHKLNDKAKSLNSAPILEPTGALDLLLKANVSRTHIAEYPAEMATTLTHPQAQQMSGLHNQDLTENLYLPQSGLVNPQALKTVILAHPRINFRPLAISQIDEGDASVTVTGYTDAQDQSVLTSLHADNVIICAAYESHTLDKRIFDCRKIRGQLSWFTPTQAQLACLPKLPLRYSGYCALFTAQTGDAALNPVAELQAQFLLGASFVRNESATDIRNAEHQISRDKLINAIPELADIVQKQTHLWQARAGVRTQTPDYHPMVGQLAASKRLWTLSAMGAKGYAFAPLCAEALADMLLGSFAPLSSAMLARLSPQRSRLQTPLD